MLAEWHDVQRIVWTSEQSVPWRPRPQHWFDSTKTTLFLWLATSRTKRSLVISRENVVVTVWFVSRTHVSVVVADFEYILYPNSTPIESTWTLTKEHRRKSQHELPSISHEARSSQNGMQWNITCLCTTLMTRQAVSIIPKAWNLRMATMKHEMWSRSQTRC